LPFKVARRADAELAGALRARQGSEALFRSDGAMLAFEKARGTQQSIIGFRIAKDCTSCGWASEET